MAELGFRALLSCANGLQIASVRELARLEELADENRVLRERLRCAEEYIIGSNKMHIQTRFAAHNNASCGKNLVVEIWKRARPFESTETADKLYKTCFKLEALAAQRPDIKTESGERYEPPRATCASSG